MFYGQLFTNQEKALNLHFQSFWAFKKNLAQHKNISV